MKSIDSRSFTELTCEEAMSINGGTVWEAAVGAVALVGTALVGGFMAGRQFVRDCKAKWFSN